MGGEIKWSIKASLATLPTSLPVLLTAVPAVRFRIAGLI